MVYPCSRTAFCIFGSRPKSAKVIAAGELAASDAPTSVEEFISVAVFVKVTYRMAAMPALAVSASSVDLTPETPTAPMVNPFTSILTPPSNIPPI